MKRLVLVAVFILIFPVFAPAADIRAFVDRTNTTIGESINLTVSISGSDAKADVNSIRDFKVVSKGTSTNVGIINGRMSKEIHYNYILMPLREGHLVIPPLSMVSDGKTFQTQAIVIQVSKQPGSAPGDTDLYVRSQISELIPYEGQQVIYIFRLYTAIKLANAKFQKPDFSGFNFKEINDTKSYKTVVNGREYTVTELSYILFPLKSGKVIIEPGTFSCDIVENRRNQRRSLSNSFMNDPFFGQAALESKIITTDTFAVDVKPLPPYISDVQFSGLVGQFYIAAKLENDEVTIGDSTTLSVSINGTGNIMDAIQPEITVPDAFKVYADNPEEHISVNRSGFFGEKIFRIALVAVKPGSYTIPPIQFSYFDVSKGQYKTIITRSFSLTTHPSSEKQELQVFVAPDGQRQLGIKKNKVEFTGRDILPLKEELDALESHKFMPLSLFIILVVVPSLFYLTIKIALKLIQKPDDPESIMVERAEKALQMAGKIDASSEELLSCLHRGLVSVIFSKVSTKGESLTYTEAEGNLRKCGYSEDVAEHAARLLQKIEAAKYGGLNINTSFKADLLSETRQFVRSLLR